MLEYRLLPLLLFAPLAAGLQQEPAERPPFWQLVERAVAGAEGAGVEGAEEELSTVLEHMAGVPVVRGALANRLSRVDRALGRPWEVPALAEELRDGLARGAGKEPVSSAIDGVRAWLDLPPSRSAAELEEVWQEVADDEREGLELLASLSTFMELLHLELDAGLAGVEPEQWEPLFGGFPGFCEAWYRNHFPGGQLTVEQAADLAAFRQVLLAPRVDRERVLHVAELLLRLTDTRMLAGLQRRLGKVEAQEGHGLDDRDVLAVVGDLPRNRVVLLGKRGGEHRLDAALVIDLAGDDVHHSAAVVDDADSLVRVVVDLAGDDRHESEGPGPAYSVAGVALLIDRKGNDVYRSGRLGQAATALGFAGLVDLEGDDSYVAHDFSQGHATCGTALLYDLEGDDEYQAWAFAQGGGIGYGFSALVDAEGDDSYLADGHWPDVYGNSGPDVHHGASQGYCTGIRSDVAGGVGALVDLGDGDDSYQSGSFSQGGGYYFSFGLMYDDGGDDRNAGSRYSQGFGVHQAVGIRWDAAGNDSYSCRSVAHTGMAWDEGVGYLLDDGGDDVYHAGGLSCGGAAQTGVAICIDGGGADEYRGAASSQGGAGGSEYHGKPALGVLIDLGSGEDSYSAPGREGDSVLVAPGLGVFLDLPERSLSRALRSKRLR